MWVQSKTNFFIAYSPMLKESIIEYSQKYKEI
ncbi:hypothetical protein VCRA2114E365_10308 [Vibrio crassostreae]|nr:hypothetical protein VCRA2115O371_10308 [Vibrio crassostreae]CAK1858938.1 hypothetical protein VCRA2114O367_10195 [Vibrio crassostreae]CAK1859979.1 hypothetical protein VCRA2117O376_10310 [Vibrio crassostreae]CAK1861776.1 hypothetical protein VCRA2114O369_10309 [Vibrio crassostreae]CAK1863938.1 hypothetical protein VCRA2113O199_10308 [Vibrio crassostreae]